MNLFGLPVFADNEQDMTERDWKQLKWVVAGIAVCFPALLLFLHHDHKDDLKSAALVAFENSGSPQVDSMILADLEANLPAGDRTDSRLVVIAFDASNRNELPDECWKGIQPDPTAFGCEVILNRDAERSFFERPTTSPVWAGTAAHASNVGVCIITYKRDAPLFVKHEFSSRCDTAF